MYYGHEWISKNTKIRMLQDLFWSIYYKNYQLLKQNYARQITTSGQLNSTNVAAKLAEAKDDEMKTHMQTFYTDFDAALKANATDICSAGGVLQTLHPKEFHGRQWINSFERNKNDRMKLKQTFGIHVKIKMQ